MKFGKKLQQQLDNTFPEWKPNFLCYKHLKKWLKQLGKAGALTFLAAILDTNQTISDSFLIPVTAGESSGGSDREEVTVSKRKSEDGYFFEDQKKQKLLGDSTNQDFLETEEASPRQAAVEEERRNVISQENVTAEDRASSPKRLTENNENFLRLVRTELHKFNAFFLEKEEEFLIRLSILEERAQIVKEKRVRSSVFCDRRTYEELIHVHKLIVRLHGEMVLLMNYSSLNYVGLLKILKKYDKHTKSNLRQLVHGSVLQQPFFSIANLKAMVERSLACEDSLQSIFPTPENVVEPISAGLNRDVAASVASQAEPIPRQIRPALLTLQEIM